MTTHAMRAGGIIVLALLVEACTRLDHIQQAAPVRTMTFDGNHYHAALCVHRRLGGQRTAEGPDRVVIANSIKFLRDPDVSHYAVTLGRAGQGGFAELRTFSSAASMTPGPAANAAPLSKAQPSGLVDELWRSVQGCAAEAKPAG